MKVILVFLIILSMYSCTKTANVGTCLLDLSDGHDPYLRKIIDFSKTQCTTQYLNDVKGNTGEIYHKSGELITSNSTSLYPGCEYLVDSKLSGLQIVDCP